MSEEQPKASANKKEDKSKKPNPNIVIPPKKPKLSKAERRALQEKQRAAKASGGGGGGKKPNAAAAAAAAAEGSGKKQEKEDKKKDSVVAQQQSGGGDVEEEVYKGGSKTLSLFSHLPQYRDPAQNKHEFSGVTLGKDTTTPESSDRLPPQVLSLGLQYADGSIRGGNARCKAMLRTFQSILQSYTPSPHTKDYRHDLDTRIIKPAFQYWTSKCRTHSVSMGNAFTFLKLAVASLPRDLPLKEVVEQLNDTIDAYIQERIIFADQVITKHACTKIGNGDVILTHAKSDVVELILLKAASKGKTFRVIVVDSRPLLEGRALVNKLVSAGIECSYILLNALSYVMMREVTKVFLGAAALMSDGSVLSRVGTGCVALMAHANKIPVLFCCETYKISSRVQLESITGNELGNPDDVVCTSTCAMDHSLDNVNNNNKAKDSVLTDWKDRPNLKLLNLLYDLTPSEYVSGIVTEVGILPPTSVAVLLREMNPQDNDSVFKSG
uniref:Translation initiation factor eIF2B subunit delta n=1 Tax=Ditylum brightwellii TaxID=49249 RepID=A0A7S4QQ98_9STRA